VEFYGKWQWYEGTQPQLWNTTSSGPLAWVAASSRIVHVTCAIPRITSLFKLVVEIQEFEKRQN